MIKDILKAFQATTKPSLSTDDAHTALAALMVRVAKADGTYAAAEISTIERVLIKQYTLSEDAAKDLRKEAEELEIIAPDDVRFTRVIKEAVAYEERSGIVEALWSVVLSDGERDDEENSFMRLVANLLGVNDRDSALARQRVMKS
ncbi:TerB family tellurite resistance protein [Amylibacter sp. SFDW26]|uniref:tellurite resistance TerB family protein n=1 Tax=Amylibacter sp. SFDW26 TaxID=2652722 RepID=UPI0012624DAB|nr:TerB family tellurite resistance protein [Amylibacter sp. SFDW26]KAB7615475.1 TerB family tellurite resistance protein [Amylibacter sp. SFDW26]